MRVTSSRSSLNVGIGAIAAYLPAPCVQLREWCRWTQQPFDKIERVVGRSFRLPEPAEDAYTMAATAVLRLIRQNQIDPLDVGFLALGTESSKDNCAGAVIVRGMVDQALEQNNLPRLRRSCEVPEFKQACLGGIYGLKGALRYVGSDGARLKAIVVASDIAAYPRGSSAEPTQGAGAVAMLVEASPSLLRVDLERAGSASAYRGPDFRRPNGREQSEYPVYSGKYSRFAYLDETMHAFDELVRKHRVRPMEFLRNVRALFLHRPYSVMAQQGAAFLFLRALAASAPYSNEDARLLALLASRVRVPVDELVTELRATPDLYDGLMQNDEAVDPYPLTTSIAAKLRKDEDLDILLSGRLDLGADAMANMGNLYTASVPAWIAAGLEQAIDEGEDLAGTSLLAIGYGSGDAAEALPLIVAENWHEAASRIQLKKALAGSIPLDSAQYEALHQGNSGPLTRRASESFRICRVGSKQGDVLSDVGVDYYEYASGPKLTLS